MYLCYISCRNYEQIGLKFQLYTPEVLFNRGLSQIYLGYPNEGLADMEEARKLKVIEEHDVIDDAIRDGGEGYTVFSIVGYPPPHFSRDTSWWIFLAGWCPVPPL
jgi:hypothetical protein